MGYHGTALQRCHHAFDVGTLLVILHPFLSTQTHHNQYPFDVVTKELCHFRMIQQTVVTASKVT